MRKPCANLNLHALTIYNTKLKVFILRNFFSGKTKKIQIFLYWKYFLIFDDLQKLAKKMKKS